jgi:excisionase family DNA binding protein
MSTAATTAHAQCAPVIPCVWLTAAEAAAYLRVDPRTVLAWARQGKVKAYALSGTARHVWRFRAEDLDAILTVPVVLSTGRVN